MAAPALERVGAAGAACEERGGVGEGGARSGTAGRSRTASVIVTANALLIQGTERRQSRCRERTRGVVSDRLLLSTDFSTALRSAMLPCDEPAPTRRAAPWAVL